MCWFFIRLLNSPAGRDPFIFRILSQMLLIRVLLFMEFTHDFHEVILASLIVLLAGAPIFLRFIRRYVVLFFLYLYRACFRCLFAFLQSSFHHGVPLEFGFIDLYPISSSTESVICFVNS